MLSYNEAFMLEAKHSLVEKNIPNIFVDRDEAKGLYIEKREQKTIDKSILIFYGVGGVGKTSLKKEIIRIHKKENKENLVFDLDFKENKVNSIAEALYTFLKSLKKEKNNRFHPHAFLKAYNLYCKKKNIEHNNLESATIPQEADLFLKFAGIFDNGITETAFYTVVNLFNTLYNTFTVNKEVKKKIAELKNKDIEEIEEYLPVFFQEDLKKYTLKHPKSKILFVIDTFETLSNKCIESLHRKKLEKWLQELLLYFSKKYLSNAQIIIFGRDKLEWNNDNWTKLLEHYELTNLPMNYILEYLQKVNIKGEALQTIIAKSCGGLPFYLKLLVDMYYRKQTNCKEINVSDFDITPEEVTSRFVENLDSDMISILKVIVVPNFYTEEIFKYLLKEYDIKRIDIDAFNRYSFVSANQDNTVFYIHDTMRKAICDQEKRKVNEKEILDIHKTMFNFYFNKCSSKTNVDTENIVEMFFHKLKCSNLDEFKFFLKTPLKNGENISPISLLHMLQVKGETITVLQIISQCIERYKLNALPIGLANLYIDMIHLSGEYEEAVSICRNYLKDLSINDIIRNEDYLKIAIRSIHHKMFFLNVNICINEATSLLTQHKTDIIKFPNLYAELCFLISGNLKVLQGNFNEAKEGLQKLKDFVYNNEDVKQEFMYRINRKLIDIAIYDNDFIAAENMLNSTIGLNPKNKKIDTRYEIYLLGSLGEFYRKKGNICKAEETYQRMYEEVTNRRNMKGWQAHAILGKAMCLINKGDYINAAHTLNETLDKYTKLNHIWGKNTTKIAQIYSKKELNENEIKNAKMESIKAENNYNINICESLLKRKLEYFQLFFL